MEIKSKVFILVAFASILEYVSSRLSKFICINCFEYYFLINKITFSKYRIKF